MNKTCISREVRMEEMIELVQAQNRVRSADSQNENEVNGWLTIKVESNVLKLFEVSVKT